METREVREKNRGKDTERKGGTKETRKEGNMKEQKYTSVKRLK